MCPTLLLQHPEPRGRPCRGPSLTPTPGLDGERDRRQEHPALWCFPRTGGTLKSGHTSPRRGSNTLGKRRQRIETVLQTPVGRRPCSGACPVDSDVLLTLYLLDTPALAGLPHPAPPSQTRSRPRGFLAGGIPGEGEGLALQSQRDQRLLQPNPEAVLGLPTRNRGGGHVGGF